MLEKLFHNQRHLREGWVNRLIGEIKSGNFRLSCDALVLVDDVLMNGQHRLNAVARSGVTCPFLVMRTSDPNIYRIIDAGIKRSVADVIVGEHRTVVSSMSSWILQYDHKTLTQTSRRAGSNYQRETLRSGVIEFIDKHRDKLQTDASLAGSLYLKSKILAPSLGAAMIFLGDRERKDDSGKRFIESLYGGTSGGAVKVLREKLINNRMGKKRWPAVYQFGLLIKGFKAWESKKNTEELRLREGEVFPSL